MTQSLGGMAESLGNFSKNHFNSVLSAPAAAMAAPAFAAAGLAKGQAYDSKSNQKHPGILAGVAKDVGKVGGDLRNIGSDVKHFRVGHLILDSLRLAKDGSGVGRHAVKNAASDVIHAGNTIKRVSWNTGAAVRTFGKSEVGMLMQNLQGSYGNRARSAAPASA
jgi:hypothetical protein